MAVLLARLGRPEAAEAHYRTALRLQPDDVQTRMNFATLLSRLGRDEDAIEQLRTVLRLRPNDPAAGRALETLTDRRRGR